MIIKNRVELSGTEMRAKALDIIEAGIKRVLPSVIMQSALKYNAEENTLSINSSVYPLYGKRLFVIGGGKASGRMAETLESILGDNAITAGVVNCKEGKYKTGRIKIIPASHPVPDQVCVKGIKEMLRLKDRYSIEEQDLVVCLLSGGGSALMTYPVDGITLEDIQEVTGLLLCSGAEIAEINAVRKHLSSIKGGRLGQYFTPATVVSLIISDVIGNDLSVIASGPTYPDSSTYQDALDILGRYNLMSGVPDSIVSHLNLGKMGEVPETPKILVNCHNHIIGDNRLALEAMYEKASELGFNPVIITAEQKGDTTAMARKRAQEIIELAYAGYDAIIIGGETTPTLPSNSGKGGRNQHYAAESMLSMDTYSGEWVLASVGTDGSDFIPDVAGAIVDNNSLENARSNGIDVESYINTFDSNTLFQKIGSSLIITGSTGTNVADVMVYLLEKS